MQKSLREGFGLTVTEALWKGRPTIGGDVGGIPLQIDDGETGYLVDLARGGGRAHDRGPRGPGARQAARPGRQGARPRALPHPAAAARLAPTVRTEARSRGPDAPSPRLVIVSNRGPAEFERDDRTGAQACARRRRPGHGAHRAGRASRRALDRLGDDRRGRRGRAARPAASRSSSSSTASATRSCLVESDPRPTTASTTSSPTRSSGSSSTTSGTSPTRRTSAARRPTPGTYGYKVVNADIAEAVLGAIDDEPEPLVMFHDYHLYTCPGARPRRAPRRLPPALRPHPVVAARQLADPARPHARGDLPRPARQRHHRLPHHGLLPQLPALLPGAAGARGRLRARRGPARRAARPGSAPTRSGIDAERLDRAAASERGRRLRARSSCAAAATT